MEFCQCHEAWVRVTQLSVSKTPVKKCSELESFLILRTERGRGCGEVGGRGRGAMC